MESATGSIVAATWRDYHELTKHSTESLRRAQQRLDWANMPDPFRHYEGVPVLDLPADPPASHMPALEVLGGAPGNTAASDGAMFLSQLLFYSAAISASKRVASTEYRYALRVNPSSGNLHPTEFHFVTRGLKNWPDGLYHYRPSAHMAEQRAVGSWGAKLAGTSAPIVFILTSIAWREAWKYGDRAYRYCLHDVGHAWQSLALSARSMGCDSLAVGRFNDEELLRLVRPNEDEWPMLILQLHGSTIPLSEPEEREPVWLGGHANQLSPKTTDHPLITAIHKATKLCGSEAAGSFASDDTVIGSGELKLPSPASSPRSFSETARMRRSALDFVGGGNRCHQRSFPLC